MGYKALFLDNGIYSAADVNEVLKSFVTSGIAGSFKDGTAYHVKKVNEITQAVSSAGTVYETDTTCKCTVNTTDKTVYIAPGTIFFADGSRIVIDTEGVTLSYTENAVNYIFAKTSPSENISGLYCQTTAPEGDCVNIAELSAEGVVTDKRIFARGKLAGYQSNAGLPMFIDEVISLTKVTDETSADYNKYVGEKTIYLGENNSYHAVISYDDSFINSGSYQYAQSWGFYDILNNVYRSAYYYGGEVRTETDKLVLKSANTASAMTTAVFKKNGNNLIMKIKSGHYNSASIHLRIY